MNYIFQLTSILIKSIASILRTPVFWLMLLVIFIQYYRIGKLERKILGANKQSVYERVIYSTLSGLLGGIIGSIIMVVLRVTIDVKDFQIIFILSLLFMLIHPRFLCFSYSGGLISIISLIFGFPGINVTSIMFMVAILHLIESLLIRVDAYKTRIPIFIDKNGVTIGGFNMLRYWPVPLIIPMPLGQQSVLSGVVAALGYGDITLTEYPMDRSRHSSNHLIIYSITLLALALFSSKYYLFKIISAIYAIIVHELIVQYSLRKEKAGKPIFTAADKGVKVLDTTPGGTAEKMGIRMGDTIISINGIRVDYKEEIRRIMANRPIYLWIDYYDRNGKLISCDYYDYKSGVKDLGILVVPKYSSFVFDIDESQSLIIKFYKWIKRKLAI